MFQLQGILDLCNSPGLLEEETRWKLKEMFPNLQDVNTPSFTARSDVGQCSPRPSTESSSKAENDDDVDDEAKDEIGETLQKLSKKFGLQQVSDDEEFVAMPISRRRTTEYDETASFTARSDVGQCSPRPSTESSSKAENDDDVDDEAKDEIGETLQKLSKKFGLQRVSDDEEFVAMPISRRRTTEYDETTEKITAQKFVDSLVDRITEWSSFKSTLELDEAILEFSSEFYNDFSAVHNEAFKSKSKIQQEFLNTDAIYITAYSTLCLAYRGEDTMQWVKPTFRDTLLKSGCIVYVSESWLQKTTFRDTLLKSGCIVYVSESWLQKVYDHAVKAPFAEFSGALLGVVQDFDGLDRRILTDVERLRKISQGKPPIKPEEAIYKQKKFALNHFPQFAKRNPGKIVLLCSLFSIPERIAARWLMTSAWDSVVQILSTFLGIKDRRKARQKVQDGVEHSIRGMQLLAAVALELELAERCGWIFENLVESSCDVDELRTLASSEEHGVPNKCLYSFEYTSYILPTINLLKSFWRLRIKAAKFKGVRRRKNVVASIKRVRVLSREDLLSIQLKRVRVLSREDLLSIQLVLDNAFVSIHAPECWKHVIRCSEYVWELEKFIYGALCYEKPSRFSFRRKKRQEPPQHNEEVGTSAADRSVDTAISNGELDKDSLSRALCILIAKVDRFYSTVGHELNLRSMRELCVAITNASENRIVYSGKKAPALTPATNLLTRISEILAPLGNRPLVHQMLLWPTVCAHFVQVASCPDESRIGVTALSDVISNLLLSESQGLCFNQMLIAPFQAIICSDTCSPETREQIVAALADFVKTKSERIGSEDQLSEAALRLVTPTYTVILNLFKTPHIPNPNLLHK
ncbi:unnamed protein product [Strongylus vulgaris]|uniref:SEC7 domain-containing protein n=1 Tax=Strongylus vulgaris TaxID=40348 RepID=A0A3P7KYZ8_STRVU|nr:unnamed protein product [Strongylus vulgaris]